MSSSTLPEHVRVAQSNAAALVLINIINLAGSSDNPEDQRAKIEVVASKREQKRAQMPPPSSLQPIRCALPLAHS